jgi:hypothetical protein
MLASHPAMKKLLLPSLIVLGACNNADEVKSWADRVRTLENKFVCSANNLTELSHLLDGLEVFGSHPYPDTMFISSIEKPAALRKSIVDAGMAIVSLNETFSQKCSPNLMAACQTKKVP